jgi:uncharacterized RDD family membrane protein YckC
LQELHATEQTHLASLGLRCAAIAIDTVVLFMALVVIFSIAAATGALNVNDPAFSGGLSLSRTAPAWLYLITYGLVFVYYTLFEALTQASVGKLALGMRVTMDDGTRPTGAAIVIRNLIRLPEILFWYIPSGISCLTNTRNKRLGDLAARTVVLRRGAAPATASAALSTSRMPTAAPLAALGPAPLPPSSPDLTASIAAFKTAALAVAGAHRSYLHFSELELAAADRPADEAHDYSPEYVAAWYTLADTVVAAQKKLAVAESAASGAGTTLQEACGDQPDLVRAVREFGPYFGAASDDQIHDAYLRVARAETAT